MDIYSYFLFIYISNIYSIIKKLTMLIGFFLMLTPAFAEELPGAGITPDNPFYFFDTLQENVMMMFTFGEAGKAELAFQCAQERLSEAKVMMQQNQSNLANNLMYRYMERMNESLGYMEMAQVRNANMTQLHLRVMEQTNTHLQAMQEIYDPASEQIKETVQTAMQTSLHAYNETRNRVMNQVNTQNMAQVNIPNGAPTVISQIANQIQGMNN